MPSEINQVSFNGNKLLIALNNRIIIEDLFTQVSQQSISIGPVNDSLFCISQNLCHFKCPENFPSCGLIPTNVIVKTWLISDDHLYIFICFNVFHGTCRRFLFDPSGAIVWQPFSRDFPVVNADPNSRPTLLQLRDVLLVANGNTVSYDPLHLNLPVLSIRYSNNLSLITPELFSVNYPDYGTIRLRLSENDSVSYEQMHRVIHRRQGYILIVFIETRSQSSGNVLKVARIRDNDFNFLSYTEIVLDCSPFACPFNITASAVLDRDRNDSVLIIGLLTKENPCTRGFIRSLMCVFRLELLQERMDDIEKQCPTRFSNINGRRRHQKCGEETPFPRYQFSSTDRSINYKPMAGELVHLKNSSLLRFLSFISIRGKIVAMSGGFQGTFYQHIIQGNIAYRVFKTNIFNDAITIMKMYSGENRVILSTRLKVAVTTIAVCGHYLSEDACIHNVLCLWNHVTESCGFFNPGLSRTTHCRLHQRRLFSGLKTNFNSLVVLSVECVNKISDNTKENQCASIKSKSTKYSRLELVTLWTWGSEHPGKGTTPNYYRSYELCNSNVLRNMSISLGYNIKRRYHITDSLPFIIKVEPSVVTHDSRSILTIHVYDAYTLDIFHDLFVEIQERIECTPLTKFLNNSILQIQCQLSALSLPLLVNIPTKGITVLKSIKRNLQIVYSSIYFLEPKITAIHPRFVPISENISILLFGENLNIGNKVSVILTNQMYSLDCVTIKILNTSIKCSIYYKIDYIESKDPWINDPLQVQLYVDDANRLFPNIQLFVTSAPEIDGLLTPMVIEGLNNDIIFRGTRIVAVYYYMYELSCPRVKVLYEMCRTTIDYKGLQCDLPNYVMAKILVLCNITVFIYPQIAVSRRWSIQFMRLPKPKEVEHNIYRSITIKKGCYVNVTSNDFREGLARLEIDVNEYERITDHGMLTMLRNYLEINCEHYSCFIVQVTRRHIICSFDLANVESEYICNLTMKVKYMPSKRIGMIKFLKENLCSRTFHSIVSKNIVNIIWGTFGIMISAIVGIIIIKVYHFARNWIRNLHMEPNHDIRMKSTFRRTKSHSLDLMEKEKMQLIPVVNEWNITTLKKTFVIHDDDKNDSIEYCELADLKIGIARGTQTYEEIVLDNN